MATDSFERSSAALQAETTIRGLLGTACREAVRLLDASACAISRVIGDLLVGLDEHTIAARPLAHGHEYLISGAWSTSTTSRAASKSGRPSLPPGSRSRRARVLERLESSQTR